MIVKLLRNNNLAKAFRLGAQQLNLTNRTQLLDLAAKTASYNLPVGNPDNAAVFKNLSVAGANSSTWHAPAGFNLIIVKCKINETLLAAQHDLINSAPSPVSWTGFARSALGNFHLNYDLRAFVNGSLRYFAITTDQNYPRNPKT